VLGELKARALACAVAPVAFLLLSGGPRAAVIWPVWCVPVLRWSWFGAIPGLESNSCPALRRASLMFDDLTPSIQGERGPL
jgi:hypothetical protein